MSLWLSEFMVCSCSIDLQDKEEDRRSFRPRIEDGVQAVHRYPWCPAADQRGVLGQQSAGVPTGQSRHYQPHHSTHWSVACVLSVRMMTVKKNCHNIVSFFLVLCTFILACSVKRVPTGQSRHYQPHHSTHWSVACVLSVRMMTVKTIVMILSVFSLFCVLLSLLVQSRGYRLDKAVTINHIIRHIGQSHLCCL